MTWAGTNATGWAELYAGNMIRAAFTMYDTAFLGWTVAILFFVYQFMLLIKTNNPLICFVTGIFFVSMYITSSFVKSISAQIMIVLLVFEFGGILYLAFFK